MKYIYVYVFICIVFLTDIYFYSQHANLAGTVSGHASWVLSVAFSPDGKNFASSSSDKTVKVWEFSTRSCLNTYHEHVDQVFLITLFFSYINMGSVT